MEVTALNADYISYIRYKFFNEEEEPPEFIESAAYDITLKLDGEKYQPTEAVEVTMKGLNTSSDSLVWVRHLPNTSKDDLDTIIAQEYGAATLSLYGDETATAETPVITADDITPEAVAATAGDGYVRFNATGFSIYIVDNENDTTGAPVNDNSTVTMTVGEADQYFYFNDGANSGSSSGRDAIWHVSNDDGAIDYEVFDNGAYVNYQYQARWIKVTAVKEGTATLTAEYLSESGNSNGTLQSRTFTIRVVDPEGFHIDDQVAESGCLVPSYVTDNTSGYTYEWSRSDGQMIQSSAIQDDGSINISIDRGGVTNTRNPITYTVNALNEDGEVVATATYEVLYGNEILNGSFENPDMGDTNGNKYYYNGYPGLYWKTTAPGTSNTQLTQDIEMIHEGTGSRDSYGVRYAADGDQFVELNAENFGALYQDILTTPGATFRWSFSHAGRTQGGDQRNNTMYVVVAATESAQKIVDEDDIDDLLESANASSMASGAYKSVTYDGTTYHIWKHRNDSNTWQDISGSITIPEGQYLTRIFFASDTNVNMSNKTLGNLIDAANAGQTMTYKINYIVDGTPEQSQTGTASVYTAVPLTYLQSYIEDGYILTDNELVLKDGNKDYPGDLDDGLYITDYGTSGETEAIVLNVYLKKQAIVVTKIIEIEGWDEMTDDQKEALIGNGLTSTFTLTDDTGSDDDYSLSLTITQVSSTGALTAQGEIKNASGNAPDYGTYTVKESAAPEIPGYDYTADFNSAQEGAQSSIVVYLNMNSSNASVTCTNTYTEAKVTLSYVAKVFDANGDEVENVTDCTVAPTSEEVKVSTGFARGSTAESTSDAWKFVGWYDNANCTGTALSTDADFAPTKPNGGWVDGTTYYAKFVPNKTSMKIAKTGEAYDETDTFIFEVYDGNNKLATVTLKLGGSVTIDGVIIGKEYIVKERTANTRYTEQDDKTITPEADADQNVVTFINSVKEDKWLSASDSEKNIFNGSSSGN